MMTTRMEALLHAKPSIPANPYRFKGKRAAMVTFSQYPGDPRPRRAADALVAKGMSVDLICLSEESAPKRELVNGINIRRLPISHRRGGKLSYAYNYCAFILMSSVILAVRALGRRYDLVYVHNMPDVLVVSAMVPKALGAKVILDLHDPMPELMTTIFNLEESSFGVCLMKRLERWSTAHAQLVITVNLACQRILTSRSCRPEKTAVVMNSPDEQIFPFRKAQLRPRGGVQTGRFVIMYHGSLVERNGLDLAVEALARVRKTIPVAELRVYGRSSPFLEKVLRDARDKGLQDCVCYLGPRKLEDLSQQIGICDVGVIPNHRSAFSEINTPTRIFEYLASGKPVIAPRSEGICDYFDDSSLIFFELGDAEDLAHQIEYVYTHPADVIEIVRRGQDIYQQNTWLTQKQQLTDLVARLFTT